MTKVYIKKSSALSSKGIKTGYHVMIDLPKKNILGNPITESWTYYKNKTDAEKEARRLQKQIKRSGIPWQLKI